MSTDTLETLPATRIAVAWEVAPKTPERVIAEQQKTIDRLLDEAQIAAVRQQMAHAFTQMQMEGYSALQNYGVNYHSLESYKDPDGLLEKAATMPLLQGQEHYFEYIRRVQHDIAAQVRRKQFQLRNGGRPPAITRD